MLTAHFWVWTPRSLVYDFLDPAFYNRKPEIRKSTASVKKSAKNDPNGAKSGSETPEVEGGDAEQFSSLGVDVSAIPGDTGMTWCWSKRRGIFSHVQQGASWQIPHLTGSEEEALMK